MGNGRRIVPIVLKWICKGKIFFGWLLMLQMTETNAQFKNHRDFYGRGEKLYAFALEHVDGFNTPMEMYSVRLGYGSMFSKNLAFYGLLDISTTQGSRILETDTESFVLNAESFGIGTSFLLRWHFMRIGKFRLFIDAGGGILYTFKSFPPQGTKLNFTARPGGGLSVGLNRTTQLSIGATRFHLSNGQGYKHPYNPAFDGFGVYAGIIF